MKAVWGRGDNAQEKMRKVKDERTAMGGKFVSLGK